MADAYLVGLSFAGVFFPAMTSWAVANRLPALSRSAACAMLAIAAWTPAHAGLLAHPSESSWPPIMACAGLGIACVLNLFHPAFICTGAVFPFVILLANDFLHEHKGWFWLSAVSAAISVALSATLLTFRDKKQQSSTPQLDKHMLHIDIPSHRVEDGGIRHRKRFL